MIMINTLNEISNSMDDFNSRLFIAWHSTGEVEDTSIKMAMLRHSRQKEEQKGA